MELKIVSKYIMTIEHGGEQPINAGISDFTAGNFYTMTDQHGNAIDAMSEANAFLKTLPLAKQDELYQAYRAVADEVALGAVDVSIVEKVGVASLATIYSIINVNAIEDFIIAKGLYTIPPDVKKEYTGEHLPDRTYIEDKYIGLCALAITLRFAIPIWGELSLLKKGTSGRRTPIPLIQMLTDTHVMSSQQFIDLEKYILGTINAGSFEAGRIVAGYGTEYNEAINTATIFVKRLAIANLTKNIATNIFNFIANKGVYNDSSTGELVWKKKTHNDDEKSQYEMYSMREKISQGDRAMTEYYLSSSHRVVKGLFRNFDLGAERMRAINKSVRYLHKHLVKSEFMPSPLNLRLAGWLLAGLVPPKTILYCGPYYQQMVVAITSVVLKNLGFVNLSMLPIAEFQYSQEGHHLAFKQSRKLIPEDIQAQLDELYPLSRTVRDRENPNMARNAINRYYVELNNSIMKLCCDQETMEYYTTSGWLNRHQRFTVEPAICADMCNALIAINKLTKRTVS